MNSLSVGTGFMGVISIWPGSRGANGPISLDGTSIADPPTEAELPLGLAGRGLGWWVLRTAAFQNDVWKCHRIMVLIDGCF